MTISSELQRRSRRRLGYWLWTGALCLVFTVSGLLYLVDPDGSAKAYLSYGYPGRLTLVYAVGLAKLAAVVVVLWGRRPELTTFALAGFLFDLLLALEAHAHVRDAAFGLVALTTLVLWIGAFAADRAGWRTARRG